MKKISAGLLVTFIIICLAVMPSCKNRAAEREQMQNEEIMKDSLSREIEENVYPLPTSAEVIAMLTELEVGYTVGITNPVENSKRYFQSNAKAINLGVYGADLSYATLYNVNQEVINYLSAIRTLAEDLKMGQIYKETLYDSIKKNFDDRDKLVGILTAAFEDTYSFLRKNEQQNLALLVVGGAWVEGMYLTTHVTEVSYNSPDFSRILLEQKDSYNEYIEITKNYMSEPVVSDFVRKLEPIGRVYEGLSTSLTEQNIKDIKTAIEGIRNQIVQ